MFTLIGFIFKLAFMILLLPFRIVGWILFPSFGSQQKRKPDQVIVVKHEDATGTWQKTKQGFGDQVGRNAAKKVWRWK